MKIQKIAIKSGYTATDVKTTVEDGEIKITYNEKAIWRPKHGEIVALKDSEKYVFAFNAKDGCSTAFLCGITSYDEVKFTSDNRKAMSYYDDIVPATPEQKQRLQDALKAKYGKVWDEEKCELVKPARWRAEWGEQYWLIDPFIGVSRITEGHCQYDDNTYKVGNYFKTREQAEKVAEKIKKLLEEEN